MTIKCKYNLETLLSNKLTKERKIVLDLSLHVESTKIKKGDVKKRGETSPQLNRHGTQTRSVTCLGSKNCSFHISSSKWAVSMAASMPKCVNSILDINIPGE